MANARTFGSSVFGSSVLCNSEAYISQVAIPLRFTHAIMNVTDSDAVYEVESMMHTMQ